MSSEDLNAGGGRIEPTEKPRLRRVGVIRDAAQSKPDHTPPPGSMDPERVERITEGWGAKIKRFAVETLSSVAESARHSIIGDAFEYVERMGVRFMNRHAVKSSENAYQKTHERSTKAEEKMNAHGQIVSSLENRLQRFNETVARIQKEGLLDPKSAIKAEAEKAALVKKIEQGKAAREKAQARLQELNDVKAGIENKQKAIAQRVAERVAERTRPFEQRVESLKPQRDQLSSEIEQRRDHQKYFVERAALLEKELRDSPFGFERDVLKKTIAEIKKELKKNDNEIAERSEARDKIEKRMDAAQTRVGKWQALGREFGRATTRESANQQSSVHEITTPNVPPASGEGGPAVPGSALVGFKGIQITPNEYISLWNKHFASEARLPENEAARLRAYNVAHPRLLDMQSDPESTEVSTRRYLIEQKTLGQLKLSEKEIDERLSSMRQYILNYAHADNR